jgi:hypothetical protein
MPVVVRAVSKDAFLDYYSTKIDIDERLDAKADRSTIEQDRVKMFLPFCVKAVAIFVIARIIEHYMTK